MSNNHPVVRIAISGKSGCGNTTVSRLLAQSLGARMINYTFRNIAQEEGVELGEIARRAETDPSWDYRVDERQISLANEGSSVLGSRLAIWLWKEADLRVYLDAPVEVRASRIAFGRGEGELPAILAETADRDRRDTARYKKLYNIDNTDYQFADLIIDTSRYNPEQIVEIIQDAWKRKVGQGT